MILLNSEHFKLYNKIINNFLEIEIFDCDDLGDAIECLFPKYLFREQYKKCVNTFKELYEWTQDGFYHQMSAFHERALYGFLEYMHDVQDMFGKEFKDIFFSKEIKQLIEEVSEMIHQNDYEMSKQEIENLFYDVSNYIDILFEDTDFLLIEYLYNDRKLGSVFLEDILGTNIDYYFELLPLDIQGQYKTGHITLTSEVSSFLKYLEGKMKYGDLYKLFWNNNKPINENGIQIILNNLMDLYFYNQQIEILREVSVGTGKVDFLLYKSNSVEEKVLIEIKKANSPQLKKGYETQLVRYMQSTKYKNAFYLIACFTDEEYTKVSNFIKNHVYTDVVQLYIDIAILDCRKRKTASNY